MNEFTDKYKIIREIGSGTEGIIFEALDLKYNKKVAIKQLYIKNEIQLEKVLKEIKIVQSFNHENIVKYFEYMENKTIDEFTGDEQCEIYIIMELCDSTLEFFIQQKRQKLEIFHTKELENLIFQICSALKEIHDKQIIHRDIKPQNILIIKKQDEFIVKLSDFGLAIFGNSEFKQDFVGTPLYIAPEINENPTDKGSIYLKINFSGCLLIWCFSL
jgi:serine/threonine protein kinase